MPSDSVDISELTKSQPKKLGGLQIVSVAERDPWINMLLYGHPGAGKTVLAGSADAVDEMCDVVVVDVEGGTMSLQSFFPQVEVVRVKNFQEMGSVYQELKRMQHPYKTVVLDSLTEIQKMSMQGIMKEVIAKEPERDPEVPSVREWGKNGEQTRAMVRAFRDLPMNVIFTALAIEEKNPKTGLTEFRPSLNGKLSREVSGFMDIVGYVYTKPIDEKLCRMMLTGTTDTHQAKDRSNRLPQVLQNPSMKTIHDIIFEDVDPQAKDMDNATV